MPHRVKVTSEEKVKVVQEYLLEGKSFCQLAMELGVNWTTIREWVSRYNVEGPTAFLQTEKNRVYSSELKLQAITDYLSGQGSLLDISKKYKLRSKSQLREWIKVYNSGKDFKHKMSGGSRMKTRQTERSRSGIRSVISRSIPGLRSIRNSERLAWKTAEENES